MLMGGDNDIRFYVVSSYDNSRRREMGISSTYDELIVSSHEIVDPSLKRELVFQSESLLRDIHILRQNEEYCIFKKKS